jgi:hypothetical protein
MADKTYLKKLAGAILCRCGSHLPGRYYAVIDNIERPQFGHPIIQYHNQLLCARCDGPMNEPKGEFKLATVERVINGKKM